MESVLDRVTPPTPKAESRPSIPSIMKITHIHDSGWPQPYMEGTADDLIAISGELPPGRYQLHPKGLDYDAEGSEGFRVVDEEFDRKMQCERVGNTRSLLPQEGPPREIMREITKRVEAKSNALKNALKNARKKRKGMGQNRG